MESLKLLGALLTILFYYTPSVPPELCVLLTKSAYWLVLLPVDVLDCRICSVAGGAGGTGAADSFTTLGHAVLFTFIYYIDFTHFIRSICGSVDLLHTLRIPSESYLKQVDGIWM